MNKTGTIATLVAIALLAGCGGNSSFDPPVATPVADTTPDPVMYDYEVTVQNLTAGQPFSPVAVIAHQDTYSIFEIGNPATTGLEVLAEAGDNADLIAEADGDAAVLSTASGDGVVGPGAASTIAFSLTEDDAIGTSLSAVTMLVNTNDAITAFRGLAIGEMAAGDSVTMTTITYDAGTEANSELIGSIPGPADGGEGFNADRDDFADEVRGHTGVITSDDGLANSVLREVHRWDNPTARVTVTRVQ